MMAIDFEQQNWMGKPSNFVVRIAKFAHSSGVPVRAASTSAEAAFGRDRQKHILADLIPRLFDIYFHLADSTLLRDYQSSFPRFWRMLKMARF